MAKLRGVRRAMPGRRVPRMPKTTGQKKVDEYLRQIGVHKKHGKHKGK